MEATGALRSLIGSLVLPPGDRCDKVTVELRGDLAAFTHLGDVPSGDPQSGANNSKRLFSASRTAVLIEHWER